MTKWDVGTIQICLLVLDSGAHSRRHGDPCLLLHQIGVWILWSVRRDMKNWELEQQKKESVVVCWA